MSAKLGEIIERYLKKKAKPRVLTDSQIKSTSKVGFIRVDRTDKIYKVGSLSYMRNLRYTKMSEQARTSPD